MVWLGLACVIGLLLRWPFLDLPMIADEGGYAYATRGWLNGTGTLYDDLWISRPQGIFYLYAIIFETLGTDTVAFRLAAWISASGTAVAVWLVARHWRPAPVPVLAAMLFTIICATPRLEGYTANAETFMMLPAAWSVWTLIRAMETRWAAHWMFLTGVLIGVATMLKPSGIVMLPFAIVAIVAMTRADAVSWREPSAWLLIGIAMIGIPALIHGSLLGWSDFLYATVTYRLTMQSSANIPLTGHLVTLARIVYGSLPLLLMIAAVAVLTHRQELVHQIRRACGAKGGVSLASLAASAREWARGLAIPPAGRHLAVPRDRVGMLLRLWTLAAFAGIAMGGDWWAHYFIQVAAPFATWLSATLVGAVRSVGRWPGRAIAAGATLMLLIPWWVVLLGSTDAISNRLFSHPGYQAQEEVATWLREHSEPGTPIFVAFDQAAIYYLADRPSAYRHLYDQELRALPESYSEIISIIRGPERPLYIVSTRQPGPYPDDSRTFWQEVGQYYELETMIEGIPIYKAREYTPPAP
jgi:4-amino-4-deoxy-L-arabinose transferase-like glycosyltransferase